LTLKWQFAIIPRIDIYYHYILASQRFDYSLEEISQHNKKES
jgi:hypothetical protein